MIRKQVFIIVASLPAAGTACRVAVGKKLRAGIGDVEAVTFEGT
jgi:hypothetical protein